MKKLLLFAFSITLFFTSCGGINQETINKLADEMCAAMELYEEENPMSIMKAATALTEIEKNADEYAGITESQLEAAMKTICPEGLVKYEALMSTE